MASKETAGKTGKTPPARQCMAIPLTPGQAVTIHGWLRPKEWLSWTDVLASPGLTMQYLNETANIPKELLHRMQPDITAWLRAGRVHMDDAPTFMHLWAAHPIRDLKADLGDVIAFQWNARTMRGSGVTYSDLRDAGMTHDTMALFGYTLYEWSTLGFSRADAESMPAASLARLFQLTKADVLRCLG
jgi:hypothetical protein